MNALSRSASGKSASLGFAILLACLSMLSPFSIDTFFPSFRSMQADLGVTALQMQQTLTFYLLPYGIMSLFHGSISDALGRRPVVLAGLALYALASLGCSLAPSFGTLIAFRMLQGICAGTGMVVSRAVVRDLYHGAEAQRLMSVMTMIFGFAPALAPVIGGWVQVWFGWRAVFVGLILLALTLWLACYWLLPETHPPEKRVELRLRPLLRSSWRVGSDRTFALLALAAAGGFAAVLVFIGSASVIVMDHWKLRETQFIWLFGPMIAGMVCGAWVSGRMAGRTPPRSQLALGFSVQLLAACVALVIHLALPQVPVLVEQSQLFGMAMGYQIAAPVLTLAMLDRFPEIRGTAASVQGFITLMIMSTIMGVVAPLLYQSMLRITAFGVGATILAWGFLLAAMHTGSIAGRYRP